MALMQLTVIPLGTGSTSVGDFVADFQKTLSDQGLAFRLNDMGTVIEGEATELLALAGRIHQMPFAKGVQRVLTQITLDDRRDKKIHLGDKIESVQARLA